MSFGAPEWLWGLLLIPILMAFFIRAERLGLRRLQEFVSARLLPQLAGTVNRPRRGVRFALQLLGLSFGLLSLAQPRWGYTVEDVKRKGRERNAADDHFHRWRRLTGRCRENRQNRGRRRRAHFYNRCGYPARFAYSDNRRKRRNGFRKRFSRSGREI